MGAGSHSINLPNKVVFRGFGGMEQAGGDDESGGCGVWDGMGAGVVTN